MTTSAITSAPQRTRPTKPHVLTAEDRVKGGHNSSTANRMLKHLPSEFQELYGEVLSALLQVRDKTMDPTAGNSISNLARSAVSVLEAGELRLLEEKLERLEQVRPDVK